MANRFMIIEAPKEILDAVVEAFASDAGLQEDATPEQKEQAAIESLIVSLRTRILQYRIGLVEQKNKKVVQDAAAVLEQDLKDKRSTISFTIADKLPNKNQ